MILEAAELVRVNLPALHALISQTKKIVYDKVTKSIHFIFLTRETAQKLREWPFRFEADATPSLIHTDLNTIQCGTDSSGRMVINYVDKQSIPSVSAI